MRKTICCLVMVSIFCLTGLIFGEGNHKYIGVKKCSMCHKSESKGNQYGQWSGTSHAKAYERLATPEALETAKKAGVTENPQESPKCLKCHVTGSAEDSGLFDTGFVKADGVQCEACHGAGGDYMSLSVMKDKAKSMEAGLVMPTKELCVKCHNSESPTFKAFNFEEYYSKISHPRPK